MNADEERITTECPAGGARMNAGITRRDWWDNHFATAHERSCGGKVGLSVQNTKPSHETARNIFKEDREHIMAAAAKHGFRIIGELGRVVSFVKP